MTLTFSVCPKQVSSISNIFTGNKVEYSSTPFQVAWGLDGIFITGLNCQKLAINTQVLDFNFIRLVTSIRSEQNFPGLKSICNCNALKYNINLHLCQLEFLQTNIHQYSHSIRIYIEESLVVQNHGLKMVVPINKKPPSTTIQWSGVCQKSQKR